jgi:chromosome segregation ATPase
MFQKSKGNHIAAYTILSVALIHAYYTKQSDLRKWESEKAEYSKQLSEVEASLKLQSQQIKSLDRVGEGLSNLRKSVSNLRNCYADLDKFERVFEGLKSDGEGWDDLYTEFVNRSASVKYDIQLIESGIGATSNDLAQSQKALADIPERRAATSSPPEIIKKAVHPEGASAKCRDGTYSYSQNRRGTCSHHGGVAEWLR